MMGFFRKPVPITAAVVATDEHELKKALANLKAANVHFDEATAIIEEYIQDFKQKQRRNYEQ